MVSGEINYVVEEGNDNSGGESSDYQHPNYLQVFEGKLGEIQ